MGHRKVPGDGVLEETVMILKSGCLGLNLGSSYSLFFHQLFSMAIYEMRLVRAASMGLPSPIKMHKVLRIVSAQSKHHMA